MNILIAGDSWGMPNYYGGSGAKPHEHTEWYLRKKGYNVHNISYNGGTNKNSITRIDNFLQSECWEKTDWILWFHTEFPREISGGVYNKKYYYKEIIDQIGNETYQQLADVKNNYDFKIAIIGGQAPVSNFITRYIKPDFIIYDWRAELLKQNLTSHLFGCMWLLDDPNCIDTIEDKTYLLDEIKALQQELHYSPIFPDGCHAGAEAHYDLVELLTSKVFL